MGEIGLLTLGSAKLLLRLLQIGGENESREELMQACRIESRTRFFTAKRELRNLGFLNADGSLNFAGQLIEETRPFVATPPTPEPVEVPGGRMVVYGETPRAEAMALDNLPNDGDRTRPNSPFQVRRKAQIEFLGRLWQASFGKPVSVGEIKVLLQLAGDYTEDILDAIEQTQASPKTIDYPLPYVKAILKRRQADVAPAPASSPPSISDGPVEVDEDFHDPVAEAKRARLRELGLIPMRGSA